MKKKDRDANDIVQITAFARNIFFYISFQQANVDKQLIKFTFMNRVELRQSRANVAIIILYKTSVLATLVVNKVALAPPMSR